MTAGISVSEWSKEFEIVVAIPEIVVAVPGAIYEIVTYCLTYTHARIEIPKKRP